MTGLDELTLSESYIGDDFFRDDEYTITGVESEVVVDITHIDDVEVGENVS